jgi:hypothetical protein
MATWASDGSSANIQSIHDTDAVTGDTITVPAGSFTWTTQVVLTKGITLEGAGASLTHVTDAVSDTNLAVLYGLCSEAEFVRVTGIEFIKSVVHSNGMVQFNGEINIGREEVGFRFDHCKINFPTAGGRGIYVYGVFGLIDHNEIVVSGPGPQQTVTCAGSALGSDGGFTPWSRPLTLGTDKAVYVEDNTFDYTGNDQAEDCIDTYSGARIVVRHNTFLSCTNGFHGTDSGGFRSPVSFEIYNNTYTNNSAHQIRALTVRGGTGVVYGNTYGGSGPSWIGVVLMYYRACIVLDQAGAWQFCNGTEWELGSANHSDDAGRTCSLSGGFRFDATDKETVGAESGSFTRAFDGSGTGGYPGRDQPGIGPGQVPEPVYVWNNGGVGPSVFGGGDPGDQALVEALIQSGRDYFYSTDNTAARPGYTAYTYPHPLAGGEEPPPESAVVIVGVPVF